MIPLQLQKASPRLTRPSGSISRRVFGGEANKQLSDICWGGAEPVNSVALRGDLPLPTHRRLMRAILLPAPWIICQYSFSLCWKRYLFYFYLMWFRTPSPRFFFFFLRSFSSWQTVQVTNNIIIIQICRTAEAQWWTFMFWRVLKLSHTLWNISRHIHLISIIPFKIYINRWLLSITYFNILSAELMTPFSFRSSESEPAQQS